MTQATRKLALVKRVGLADLSEGWEDCYALVRPATYHEYLDFMALDLKDKKPQEKMEAEFDVVTSHFVSGKVKVYVEGSVEPHLVDMTAEDIKVSIPLANKLFSEILGFKLDPKDSDKAA